jgi:hypothetical protein
MKHRTKRRKIDNSCLGFSVRMDENGKKKTDEEEAKILIWEFAKKRNNCYCSHMYAWLGLCGDFNNTFH